MKRLFFCFIISVIFMSDLFSDQPIFDENLCANNEEVVLSFKMRNSSKTLSILTAKDYSYIVYRFGTRDNVELEFPQNKIDSWKKFTLYIDSYIRASCNYRLSFINGNYRYDILEEFMSEDGRYQNYKVGVRVINISTNTQTFLEGVFDSRIGRLSGLDNRYFDLPRYGDLRILKVIETEYE